MKLNIATDFSVAPGSRYAHEGKFSGQDFRTQVLLPMLRKAIEQNCILEVSLDGTAGFGTSFLEESFGGLIRENKIDLQTIKKSLKLISQEEPALLDEINEYLQDADRESKK